MRGAQVDVTGYPLENFMLGFSRPPLAFACAVFFLCNTTVLGDGGLMITLLNDSSDSLLVTAYDQGIRPPQLLVSDRAIYGNASMTVSIAAGRQGRGHLSWTAVTVDRDMRKCGQDDKSHLNDGDTVNVHADGDCHR
jgi:hypothetical protein